MRLSGVISVAISLGASIQVSGTSDSCGAKVSVTTVVVISPAVTSFVTLDLVPVASVDVSALNANLDITPLLPTTVTRVSSGDKATHVTYLTYTHVVTVEPPTSSPAVAAESDKGTYFYAVQSGSTVWLNDKTPTATSGLIYGTTTVVVSPVPTSESQSESTTTSTTVLKKTSTTFVTVTTTQVTGSVSSSTRSYPGYGSNGWNSTTSSLQGTAIGPTGTGFDKPEQTIYKPTVTISTSQVAGSGYAPVGTVKPYRRFKGKRAPDQWITATVNDQVFSWISPETPSPSSEYGYGPAPTPTPAATPTQYTITRLLDLASLLEKLNNKQASSVNAVVAIASPTASEPTYVSTQASTTSYQPSETTATADTMTTVASSVTGDVVSTDLSTTETSMAYASITETSTTETSTTETSSAYASPIETSTTETSTTETTSTVTSTESGTANTTQTPTTVIQQLETVGTSATSVTTSAAASPSSCGEYGNFTLDFEDLPNFTTGNDTTPGYPPIFSPYHHLFFSDGFGYAPPPSDPYVPVSPPHLAIFVPSEAAVQDVANGPPDAPNAGYGSITAGPRASDDAYWFDILGGYWGCQDAGPEDCTLHFHVFQWKDSDGVEAEMSSISRTIPACPDQGCSLSYFGEGPGSQMRNMTTLKISAEVGGVPKNFFVDDLQLRWTNSSCEAGRQRQSSR